MTEDEKKTLSDLFEAMGRTGAQFQIGQVIGSQVNNYYGNEKHVPTADDVQMPEPLMTEEAMALWEKVKEAGWVDDDYQPLISRSQASLLADAMAEKLGIKEKWKAFEGLWNRRNMYRDYYKALSLQQSLAFQDEVKKLFG